MYTLTCEPLISRKMDCGDQNTYHRFPTMIIISDLHFTDFPNISSYRFEYNSQKKCYILLKSLLANKMLLSKSVAHNIFLISNNLLETICNHFDLFLMNNDDNQHVLQSYIGLVNVETFMANTCLLTVLGKNGCNPRTISNLTVTIFNQQHYHYC